MAGITLFIFYLSTIGLVIYFWWKTRYKLALIAVFTVALIPRIWLIDNPSLGNNDEKYHALVAKNLSKDPLKPALYKEPVLSYDIHNWAGNHIWLSKPPLSLWFMAGSIHFFGSNVVSVRLASFIFSLLSLSIIYLLAGLFYNQRTAILAAFFFAIHGTFIELSVGEISSDHVDICFNTIFLIAIYFGVKSCVYRDKNYLNTILFSILTGLLFLTKWHVSFLIFPIYIVFLYVKRRSISNLILKLALVLGIHLLVILPWLFYVYDHFPIELNAISKALISPVTNVIQGHSGAWYYYIIKLGKLYGEFTYIPIIYLMYHSFKYKSWQSLFILAWIIIPILAFSVVETKRFPYLLIISPAIFIYTSYFITHTLIPSSIAGWIKKGLIIGLIALPIRFSIERIDFFTDHEIEYAQENLWKVNLIEFANTVKDQKVVIFKADKYIEIMFYTDLIAYRHLPTNTMINQLEKNGYSCYKYENGRYSEM